MVRKVNALLLRVVMLIAPSFSQALKIAEEEDLLVLAANLRVALALLEEDIPERKTLLQEVCSRSIFGDV